MEYAIRLLDTSDYEKGYLKLLSQLTTVGDISEETFKARVEEMRSMKSYFIHVIEDTEKEKIIGTASLIIELKFIHGCSKIGHIEDVVVDSTYRGLKLGQKLIDSLVERSRAEGCYKTILDCAESNSGFYEKCGFKKKEIQMVQYHD
uniref:Glucosamine 6-phosphate N-acetyltransferase n=1 Tax=Polytomella parva TaxID=51329 RepID=A0A7S0YRJ5_9CHLO|mmetsp:Transcript_9386/g.17591  ORF Transcript_9386/g.17591 Transcript_9386/m.17591 type:complete len:147 (+) Transcript_9386:85-525(+)